MTYQSLYSWYGNQPPAVDYIPNTDAKGFVTRKQEQGASDFVGVQGNVPGTMQYQHTGIRNLGNMTTNLRPFDSQGNPARDTFVRGSVGNFTTRYQNNSDNIPSITARGFERDGASSISFTRTAKDEFLVDNVTFSNRGIAKRRAQLGDGSKFPIGPAGQIHSFDILRTGFFDQNRYGSIYNAQSNSGLADTYTANSPIDDMYNKYKIRDESHNPFTFGVTRQPFVLRGIQRDDNSDPQRWGLDNTIGGQISGLLDIPRGGPLTFATRAVFDAVRLGKFAISPKGLAFLTKQFGLQFMNPNVENIFGTAMGLRPTQLYDPTSAIVNAVSSGLGIRFDRHLPPIVTRGKYEQIHQDRGAFDPTERVRFNRLVQLGGEYGLVKGSRSQAIVTVENISSNLGGAGGVGDTDFDVYQGSSTNVVTSLEGTGNSGAVLGLSYFPKGQASSILTGRAGPKSVLGIGVTRISRGDQTNQFFFSGNNITQGAIVPLRYLGNQSYNDIIAKNPTSRGFGYIGSVDGRRDVDDGYNRLLIAVKEKDNFLSVRPDEERSSDTFGIPDLQARRIYHDSLFNIVSNNELWLNHSDNTVLTPLGAVNETQYGGGNAVKSAEITADAETGEVTSTVNTLQSSDYNRIRAMAKNRQTGKPIDFRKVNAITDVNDAVTAIQNNSADILYDNTDPVKEGVGARYTHYQTQGSKDTRNKRQSDLIFMMFGSYQFYAYITSLTDQSSPNFDTGQDLGTINPRYQYTSYERTISITFIAAAFDQEHYDAMWRNLKALYEHSWGGTALDVNIGGVHQNLSSIITDMTYNWDVEYPWDIDPDRAKPIYTEVSITFKVLSATGNTDLFNTLTHDSSFFPLAG